MVQQERDEDSPGLTEMVLDAEPSEPKSKAEHQAHREPPEGEDELPLAGQ